MRQQHRKLVAAEPRYHVSPADSIPEQLGEPAEQIVAGAVTPRVVHILELVEVDEQQRAMHGIALRLSELSLQFLFEAPAVE